MNILIHPNDFNLTNIYFLDKKTNIIMDGVFTKIVYSNSYMSMNGLYIYFPIKNVMTNRINSKHVMHIDLISNKDFIQRFIEIEKQLLEYYILFLSHTDVSSKTICYTLKNNFQNGHIKYYKEYDTCTKQSLFYIKISGIWENKTEIGITFKIIEYQK
jgi:hypothetical protein